MVQKIGPTTPHGYFRHQRGAIITDHSLFTDDNDHNPLLAKVCPKCGGKPIIIVEHTTPDGRHIHGDGVCDRCRGLGVIDEPGEWFSNGADECVVRPNVNEFLQCPGCGKRFSHRDPNVDWKTAHLRPKDQTRPVRKVHRTNACTRPEWAVGFFLKSRSHAPIPAGPEPYDVCRGARARVIADGVKRVPPRCCGCSILRDI